MRVSERVPPVRTYVILAKRFTAEPVQSETQRPQEEYSLT